MKQQGRVFDPMKILISKLTIVLLACFPSLVFCSTVDVAVDHHPLWTVIRQHDSDQQRESLVRGDEKALVLESFGLLFHAVMFGYSDLVETLVSDPVILSEEGAEALYGAASLGRLDVISVLLGAGLDVNQEVQDGITALFGAVEFGDIETICMLIENGAAVNHRARVSLTLLVEATVRQRPDIVKLLLSSGYEMQAGEEARVIGIAERIRNDQIAYIIEQWHSDSFRESIKDVYVCNNHSDTSLGN